jgi:hypothetical protein
MPDQPAIRVVPSGAGRCSGELPAARTGAEPGRGRAGMRIRASGDRRTSMACMSIEDEAGRLAVVAPFYSA